ncbi:MAG: hypothetical protein WBA91_06680 [Paracoccaceae bacterium]
MNLRQMLRLAQWARKPPSPRRMLFWGAILAVGLGLSAIEKLGYWPEILTVNPR